jgi:hypothetical protein
VDAKGEVLKKDALAIGFGDLFCVEVVHRADFLQRCPNF